MHSLDIAPEGKKQNVNALIIDKEGVLGEAVSQVFSEQVSTFFVSKVKAPSESSIIHIPFSETIPAIPDGYYSYILYVFHDEDKDLLEPLMKKAAQDKIKFFIIIPYEQVPLLSEYVAKKDVYGHVVVLGDLFGNGKGEIDQWLYDIKKEKKITLSSMGLNSWYPVYFPDAIQTLVTICVTSPQTEREIYLLAPTHPLTHLTLSHALQKVDPTLKIDFSEEESQVFSSLPKGKHMLEAYNALDRVIDYYKNLTVKESAGKVPLSLFSTPLTPLKQKKKRKGSLLFIVYTLVIFMLMPAVLMFATAGLGKWLLLSGIEDIKQGNFSNAQQKIHAAQSDIALSQFSLQLMNREVSLFGQQKQLVNVSGQLSLASSVASVLQESVIASTKIQSVLVGKSLNPIEDTKDGVNALKVSLIMLQKLQTEDIPLEYKNKLQLVNTYSSYIETLVEALPQLIGAEGERRYLVLFQNNTELRPGGGFIGSYGVLRVSHGKIRDFVIHDVYEADGQLKGHVEPPFAIRRYIPLVHLYLRDSNFDVDFEKNAEKAAFMLQAETGETVDGVIGLDLSFVQKMIEGMGSVYVPEYNQTVTNENFFLLTEQHAEKNSFPGSTQKKDFLSALFLAMQNKLLSRSGTSYEKIVNNLFQAMEEKHFLVVALDRSLQASFAVNGLSSTLVDDREREPNTLNDFLGINEANIGVNKVNYSVTRSVSQKVLVSDKGIVKETVTLTFTNASDGTWPGGVYKNYLRFILPKNTRLDAVSINGADQKILPAVTDPQFYEISNFIAPKGLEVEKTEENGKTLFGFLVTIPTKATMQIAISYTLADIAPTAVGLPTYSLQLFKQPGVDQFPYSLEVGYPRGFAYLTSNQKVQNDNSVVSFNQNVSKDTSVTVSFVRK